MLRILSRFILALSVTLCAGATAAGQLSQSLTDSISALPTSQFVSVWIQLTEIEGIDAIKASVEPSAGFEQRYRSIGARLRSNNATNRQALVADLAQLQNRRLADRIRTHWLVNIVEAEVAAGALAQIGARADVLLVAPAPTIRLIAPTTVDLDPAHRAGVADHLSFINADAAWAAGYTGQGRLVCSFDTGIDGDHPALSSNWKGNDGDQSAAWFDPRYDGQTTPRTIYNCGFITCNPNHGTHTMGTMVGHDNATGDTVGVAPDAQWISAAVIDVTGASIIDAFEWAADPDGDPNTIDDVPDVINHSWGVIGIDCQNLFYDIIDATEALGIVNIFAAGNEGVGSGGTGETIRNPANRALDSIDCFATGGVDARAGSPVIYSGSSRGPSDCNGAIKPNVTAPGVSIISTLPNGGYGLSTGTSMAAPQVAGLVALMREKNPNATVEQIKTAILSSALDHGYSLPDNNYGWGVIDCMAALNALPVGHSRPSVRVYSFDHAPIAPGDTVRGTIYLQNIGLDVSDVSISLISYEPLLTVITGTADFGGINEGQTKPSNRQIEVMVSGEALEGAVLTLNMAISGSDGYSDSAHLYFLVQPQLNRSIGTHDVGRIRFSLTNFGSFGLGDGQFFPAGGEGFTFDGSQDYMYEGGLVIGTDATHVSDGIRNATGEIDGDFGVLPGGNIAIAPGPFGSQQINARFGDQRAEIPIGLAITQESFAFPGYPNDDFIILRYALTNTQQSSINGLYIGIYIDWDVVNWQANAGGFSSFDEFVWTAYNSGGIKSQPRGAMVLEGTLATAWIHPGTIVSYNEDGFTESEKFDALTDGFGTGNLYENYSSDLVQMIAVGPLNLTAGETNTVAFALMAADDLSGMTSLSDRARVAYDSLPVNCCISRGDFDHDGEQPIDITDLIELINYMFQSGPDPICFEEGDINGSGGPIDISDAIHLIDYMFLGGPPPAPCP